MALLEWILFGITIGIMMLQLLMLKKGYLKFFYTLYGVKSLEKIREGIVLVNNKMFKLKKELLISSSTVIIALLSMFILTSFLNIKIGFPPDTFLWMVGGLVVIPLFIIIFDFYLKQTILEIDKIKSKSINRKENKLI
jgi:hypothetical protein